MKFFFAASVMLMLSTVSYGQTTGVGCRIANNVYTQYLGVAYPYGPSTPVYYYKSTGPNVAINYNSYNGSNAPSYYGYTCGRINVFPASSTGPAQQESVDGSSSCIIASTLGGATQGNGVQANYAYNNPTYCATPPPMALPLDEHMNQLSIVIGIAGFFIYRRKAHNINPAS